MSTSLNCEVLSAPSRIVSETRTEFRKAALDFVEQSKQVSAPAVCVDLSETTEVDASGLGILVLIQKRARELGLAIRLLNVPSQVRYLLALTKLDHLFEIA